MLPIAGHAQCKMLAHLKTGNEARDIAHVKAGATRPPHPRRWCNSAAVSYREAIKRLHIGVHHGPRLRRFPR
jgi:hypothetical protein